MPGLLAPLLTRFDALDPLVTSPSLKGAEPDGAEEDGREPNAKPPADAIFPVGPDAFRQRPSSRMHAAMSTDLRAGGRR
ncbi:MAG: hypothetical protein CMH16_24575 [Methylobacterium sp.]|nr:hypothetical protein [Methylobacterium sp.]